MLPLNFKVSTAWVAKIEFFFRRKKPSYRPKGRLKELNAKEIIAVKLGEFPHENRLKA